MNDTIVGNEPAMLELGRNRKEHRMLDFSPIVRRVAGFVLAAFATCVLKADEAEQFFESKIRPILVTNCFECHGDFKESGSFRVDSREAILKGGDSGAAIVPGNPAESLLIKAIERKDDVTAMPPEKPLRPEEVQAITAWVKAGAHWPATAAKFEGTRHWAFEPLRNPPLPKITDGAWPRNAIDAFVLAKLESERQRPVEAADRRTLIRRATYDLLGLPPTPEETEAFLQDARDTETAFETVVQRLLASPHYGERWGRHWLDVVRYADTAGENSDHPLPHAWRYRNWVIDRLNEDRPYDVFIREQIAGDLLAATGPPEKFADQTIATGYLAIARRFGHDIEKDIHLTYEDVIDNVGKSVLGLTLACCRCHDHKYDPLSMKDYYGLYGILESTKFSFPGCEPVQQPRDLISLVPTADAEGAKKAWRDRVAAVDAELKQIAEREIAKARELKERTTAAAKLISAGDVEDAKSADFAADIEVELKSGDALLLTVLPRGNHGADSSRLEWRIAEVGGESRLWSTQDLIATLLAGNPHRNTSGEPLWFFLDAQDGYRLLGESFDALNNRKELKAWKNGDTPSVFVNTSEMPVPVWTTLPPRSFFIHPGEKGPAAIAWISPLAGKVRISGKLADIHPGGDGVAWKLEHAAGFSAIVQELLTFEPEKKTLRERRAAIGPEPTFPVAYAVREAAPKNARVHLRGDPEKLGAEVPRKFIDALGGGSFINPANSGRLELADKLIRHPLAARVIVNRVWQGHFGQGIVKTPNDFGTRGSPPSHPDLFEYLAAEFVGDGWSLKRLHQRIMLSATYRQGTSGSQPNELFRGFVRRRLSAEEVRDTLLALSDKLDRTPAEGHPFPAETTWNFTQHAPFAADYDTSKRSVYLLQKRNRRHRFLALFDGADPNASTAVRDTTTVPAQALFWMNDPFVHGQVQAFAERVAAGKTGRARLDAAYRLLFSRSATTDEHAAFEEFAVKYGAALGMDPAAEKATLEAYCRVLFSSNELLFVD